MQRADLFIGADSGPAHLAASVACPVIALFSGTNSAAQWRPWGEHVKVLRHSVPCSPCHRTSCVFAAHPCMSGLLPEVVLQAATNVLGPPAYAAEKGATAEFTPGPGRCRPYAPIGRVLPGQQPKQQPFPPITRKESQMIAMLKNPQESDRSTPALRKARRVVAEMFFAQSRPQPRRINRKCPPGRLGP